MAIGTGDNAFIYPMLGGHIELRADRGMTLVAKIDLLLGKQRLRADRSMNGVTTRANYIVQGVFRTADFRPAQVFSVTVKTVIQNTFWW
jgi:hypothetical protein